MKAKLMNEKKVFIEMTATIDSGEGEPSVLKIETNGVFSGNDENYTVTYEEKGDLEGCVTVLKMKNGEKLSMKRSGGFSSELILENKKRHVCAYETPYGRMDMGFFAHSVVSEIKNGAGLIAFDYSIDSNGASVSRNRMELRLKEAD